MVRRLSIPAAVHRAHGAGLLKGVVALTAAVPAPASASKGDGGAVAVPGKTLDITAGAAEGGGDVWTDRGQMYRVVDASAAVVGAGAGAGVGAAASAFAAPLSRLLRDEEGRHTFFGMDSF